MVKNLPAMQKRWVPSLGWEDPLEEPTPVFLPGESRWTEKPGGLYSRGSQRIRHDWVTKNSTAHLQFYFMILLAQRNRETEVPKHLFNSHLPKLSILYNTLTDPLWSFWAALKCVPLLICIKHMIRFLLTCECIWTIHFHLKYFKNLIQF